MQDSRKAVWSIQYVSVAFFPSLKQNYIAYRSSKVSSCPDCIFEIHQLWQSGFSRVNSNCCCSCSFEAEILKIGQSSHNIYSNNIVNFKESTTILNACTKKIWKPIECTLNKFYRSSEKIYFLNYHWGKVTWIAGIIEKRIGKVMFVIKHLKWKVIRLTNQIKKSYTQTQIIEVKYLCPWFMTCLRYPSH